MNAVAICGTTGHDGRFVAALLLALSLAASACVEAAELRVLCPHALREPALELARSFARASGHRIEFVFASVGAIHKRAAMNERADVVIGHAEGIAALVKLGSAEAGTETPIARAGLALIARTGVQLPEPGRTEAIERALGEARAIGVPDAQRGAPGGAQALAWIEQLPSASTLHSKLRAVAGSVEAVKLLATNAIDLALVAMSDVAALPGIAMSGPIVSAASPGIAYAAAVPRLAQQPQFGREFIAYLRTAEADKVLRTAGYVTAER